MALPVMLLTGGVGARESRTASFSPAALRANLYQCTTTDNGPGAGRGGRPRSWQAAAVPMNGPSGAGGSRAGSGNPSRAAGIARRAPGPGRALPAPQAAAPPPGPRQTPALSLTPRLCL